ncbi:MAG: glycosyltransferase family 4 protein [bacterium]|nr:glycosyltransferase family 4 protein [bacterium]
MKILHVVHAYSPAIGGTEFLVKQVSEYLANEAKEDVTVFTTFAYNTALFSNPGAPSMPAASEEETINGVRVKRFPVKNRWGRYLYFLQYILYRLRLWGNGIIRMIFYGPISPQMKKGIMESEADIIAAAPFPLNHTNYVFKNRGNKPVILIGCIHTSDKHGFSNPRIIKNIKRAAGYVALTDHEKEFLVRQWGIDEKKIRVIGVGLEMDNKEAVESPAGESQTAGEKLRARLGIAADAPVVAFVGQHGLHKGIETLILAMQMVWRLFPGVRLVVAGGTSPFSDAFKELGGFLDNHGRISFFDNIEESVKSEILAGCDIFTTPSGFESFGITILEAWKRKKPVIACRIPATMNLINEYETGLLVDYQNPTELAEALKELLSEPSLGRKLGENGYKKLKKKYAADVVGKQYHEFYREVLSDGR